MPGRRTARRTWAGAQAALLLAGGESLEVKGGHGKDGLATFTESKTGICLPGLQPERRLRELGIARMHLAKSRKMHLARIALI